MDKLKKLMTNNSNNPSEPMTKNSDNPSELLKKLTENLEPVAKSVENVLEKTTLVTEPIIGRVLLLPIILAIVDFIVILIYLVLIVIYIINPEKGFGIPISRNIYSIFYLTTTIVLFLLLVGFGNPILDSIEPSPDNSKTSKSKQFIDELFSYFNKIISISLVPVIILETIFLVLLVFIISFMFIISTSMVRTYFALQCNYGQMIRASWWAYLVDVIMYCLLFVSFICWCILQFASAFNADVKWSKLYLRRIFLITFAYYILKIIFSALEYGISNNIMAISKWNQETNECLDKTESPPNKPINIFYLFLNIMLCILIWLLILILIIGHLYVGIFFSPYISKANIIVKIINDLFLFILSGTIEIDSIENKIKSIINTISKIIPGLSDKVPDVIGIAKTKVDEMLAANPDTSASDFVKQLIETGATSMNSGSFGTDIMKQMTQVTQAPVPSRQGNVEEPTGTTTQDKAKGSTDTISQGIVEEPTSTTTQGNVKELTSTTTQGNALLYKAKVQDTALLDQTKGQGTALIGNTKGELTNLLGNAVPKGQGTKLLGKATSLPNLLSRRKI